MLDPSHPCFAMAHALLTFLLQSSLLLALCWLALRVVRASAGRVWLLRGSLLGPVLTAAVTLSLGLGTPVWTPQGPGTTGLIPFEFVEAQGLQQGPLASGNTGTLASMPVQEGAPPGAPLNLPWHAWPLAILGISALLALRLVGREWRARRTLRDREPFPLPLVSDAIRPLLRAGGPVRLTTSFHVSSPLALGPSEIVLPERLLDAPAKELDAVLAHELAHLARRDPLWLGMARMTMALAWFQPGFRWALRQLEQESEVAADTWAVERTGEPLELARALQRVAEFLDGSPVPAAAATMARRPSIIVTRVERLVACGPRERLQPAPGMALMVCAGLGVLACAGPVVGHASRADEKDATTNEQVLATVIASVGDSEDRPREYWDVDVTVLEPGKRLDPVTGEAWSGSARYRFDSSRKIRYSAHGQTVTDLQDLREILAELYARDTNSGIRLHPGDGIVYDDIVDLFDVCIALGYMEVAFPDSQAVEAREYYRIYGIDTRVQGQPGPIQHLRVRGDDALGKEGRAVITLSAAGMWVGLETNEASYLGVLRTLASEMRKGPTDGRGTIKERTLDRLLIRAHPNTPFGKVEHLIQLCADTGIWRIELAPSTDTAEAIVPVFLPGRRGPEPQQPESGTNYHTFKPSPEASFAEVYAEIQSTVAKGNTVVFGNVVAGGR